MKEYQHVEEDESETVDGLNEPADEFVVEVAAISRSSVYYQILAGNEAGHFDVNPNTGVVTTEVSLDYEEHTDYNLTVEATNMVGLAGITQVLEIQHDSHKLPEV